MKEKQFRSRISWLMFCFSVLVIWGHSYNVDLFVPAEAMTAGTVWGIVHQIEDFLSYVIAPLAVPGFFMLSSYLFFRSFSWEKLASKWKGRFFSVALPYLTWNLLYYIGYAVVPRLPFFRAVIGKETAPLSVGGAVVAIIRYQYAPVFWYLYQLIILIFLSPAIYLFVKRRLTGVIYLALLLAAVYFRFDIQNPNTDALFYYSFAAFAAIHGRNIVEETAAGKSRIIGAAGLALTGLCAFLLRYPYTDVLWIVLIRFFVVVFCWFLTAGEWSREVKPYMKLSLFLYAVHYIVVRFVNKASALLLTGTLGAGNPTALLAFAIYLALPAVVVAVSYGAALFLGRWLPPLWKLLSGGRNIKEEGA